MKTIDFDMVTTKGGDAGMTSLFSGERISKEHLLIEVIGSIDELQSEIGAVRNELVAPIRKSLRSIQQALYSIMATLSTNCDTESYIEMSERLIYVLEKRMKKLMSRTTISSKFIIPGDDGAIAAKLDVLRTKTRSVERLVVKYIKSAKPISVEYNDLYKIQNYFNRLSDYFFILARATKG